MSFKYLRVCSDLHLEGFAQRNPETLAIDFLPRDDRDAESVLILAGDISSNPDQLIGFLRAVEGRFRKVIFVPGNHELYKHDLLAWNAEMTDRMNQYLSNTVFTDASTVGYYEFEGVRFIYGTLWGDGGPTLADQAQVGFYLNDFRLISNGAHPDHGSFRKFTVSDMIAIHKDQKAKIDEYLNIKFEGKTVVITHHLPSRDLVSARFWPRDGSDGANGGFVGDCRNMIASLEPTLWIHGHTHDTIDDKLWNTRVICNPAGYRGEWASPFNEFMVADKDSRVLRTVPKFVALEEL